MVSGSSTPSSSTLLKSPLHLKFLREFSSTLSALLESPHLYQELVRLIQSRLNFQKVDLWTITEDPSCTFTLLARAGSPSIHHRPMNHEENEFQKSLLKKVLCNRQFCSTQKNQENQENREKDSKTTLLATPVLREGEVLAILCVESDSLLTFQNHEQDESQLQLETAAALIATAMTHQKLSNEASRFNKKLQQAVDEKTLELRRAHERILEQQREQQRLLQKENRVLKTLVNHESKTSEIVGKSPTLMNLLTMVDKIAPTDATVLIQGESGTGKELIARRLHFKSQRSNNPYVTVNCGALQESLLESELFGHERGSFTGAIQQKMGLCETADGGSLFLDEIGELSLGIQAKLLRFLQEGEFYRIGGKKPIRVSVRIISASNRDLERAVQEGRFREDLFYRLNTIMLRLPPLRKRKEDIPMLAEYFLKNSRFGGISQQIKRVDPRVMEVLSNYPWPGNIRELQNTVERLKILAEHNEIRLDDLPFTIRMPKAQLEASDFTLDMPLEDVEKSHILRALAYHQGNKTKTAQSLGITIKTLYNKLHRYGILHTQNQQQQQNESLNRSSEMEKPVPLA